MAISPKQLETGKEILDWLKHALGPLEIRVTGSGHLDRQEMALAVHEHVSFAAPDFFPISKPFWGPRTALVLMDWLSMIAALGSSSRPCLLRTRLRRACKTWSQMPSSRQVRKYQYSVPQAGKSWGTNLQGQPLRNT